MSGYEHDENGNSTERTADLVVRKWRNGRSNFIIPLDFDPPKMKFTERDANKISGFVPVQSFYESDNKTDSPF
jgi:hypothetical protein